MKSQQDEKQLKQNWPKRKVQTPTLPLLPELHSLSLESPPTTLFTSREPCFNTQMSAYLGVFVRMSFSLTGVDLQDIFHLLAWGFLFCLLEVTFMYSFF